MAKTQIPMATSHRASDGVRAAATLDYAGRLSPAGRCSMLAVICLLTSTAGVPAAVVLARAIGFIPTVWVIGSGAAIGVLLPVVAIVRVYRSGGQLTGSAYAVVALTIGLLWGVVFVVIGVIVGAFGGPGLQGMIG